MASLPTPIRATLGLLATALDAVQELVDHAPEIPMEAVGNSMQLSLRLQQQYVALQTRGDEFLASLRGAPEEPPAWATFDEPPPPAPDRGEADTNPAADAGVPDTDLASAADLVSEADLVADADWTVDFESVAAVDALPEAEIQDGPRHAAHGDPLLAAAARGRAAPVPAVKAPAAKAPGAKAPAKKSAAKKAPAKKVAAKKVAAKKAAAKKAPATGALGQDAPAKRAGGVKAAPAKAAKARAAKAPGRKTAAGRSIARETAPAAPALNSTGPILTSRPAAKRGRPPKNAGSDQAAAPQLDANLSTATAGTRHQSAFDLAETPMDVGTDGIAASALTADTSSDNHTAPETDITETDQPTSAE